MKHIPHVTLSTNYMEEPELKEWGKNVKIIFEDKNLYRLPQMYQYEPDFNSAGFYCKIDGYNNPLLHMTMSYEFSGIYTEQFAPEDIIDATIYKADTRPLDPGGWFFF